MEAKGKNEGMSKKSEAEWKDLLTPEQFEILRRKGTERPFTGQYYQTDTSGRYLCAGCSQELFTSVTTAGVLCSSNLVAPKLHK